MRSATGGKINSVLEVDFTRMKRVEEEGRGSAQGRPGVPPARADAGGATPGRRQFRPTLFFAPSAGKSAPTQSGSPPGDAADQEEEGEGEASYQIRYRKRRHTRPLITWKKRRGDNFGVLLVQRGKSDMIVRIPIREDKRWKHKEVEEDDTALRTCVWTLILVLALTWAFAYS